MNNLFEKELPEFVVDAFFEQENRLSQKKRQLNLNEISVAKGSLYFDLNKIYQKNKLYLLKRKGDMMFVLNTMFLYSEETTKKWLESIAIKRENSSEDEICEAINECENTFVIDLLKNLRNALDKEMYEKKMYNNNELMKRNLKTTEMFAKSVILNIK